MSFQKTVFMIAVVLFILIMTVVGVLMRKSTAAMEFPPEIGGCPDYWKLMNNDDNKKVCINVKGLGTCDKNEISLTKFKSRKEKCEWADGCNVEWDGITNQGLC